MIDYSAIISSAIPTFLLLLIVVIVIEVLKSPKVKGWSGEKFVKVSSQFSLDSKRYIQFHDVTLYDRSGHTTQIDHIIISPYGIFVIETKNYSGWIFGSEHDSQWTQKIYKKSYQFQNPLRQNYRHIKVLSDILNLNQNKFISIIVFTGEC